jgi:hypothetical protein
MKISAILGTIFLVNVICSNAIGQSELPFQIEHEIVQLRSSNSGLAFRLSLYNNSDSVLCILTSVAGTYRKGIPERLASVYPEQDSVLYNLDKLAADTLVDTYLPTRRRICVLPFQAKEIDLIIPKSSTKSFLRINYYYSADFTFSVKKTEKYKPMWFKKYDIKSYDLEILGLY